MRVVITGGHHSSALPVIAEFKKRDLGVEIFWIGHRHSLRGNRSDTLEYREVSSLGIPFYDLKAGKFYRTYDPVRLARIPLGFVQALFYLLKVKPDIIVSFGGYLAVPVVLSGWVLGIPSVTHEQTVVTGYANKLVSKFAKKIFVSWEQSLAYFPPEKTIFTGLPLRESILKGTSDNFGICDNLPTLYITAGKTGSHIINTLVLENLESLLKICNVIHQCGEHSKFGDYELLQKKYQTLLSGADTHGFGKYHLRKFVMDEEIGEAYQKADLILSRAGAHTIYELLALRKPAILIPIPWVSHDEQNKNAQILVDYGLAKILDQANITVRSFYQEIKESFENLGKYVISDSSVKNVINFNSAKLITDEILKIYKK